MPSIGKPWHWQSLVAKISSFPNSSHLNLTSKYCSIFLQAPGEGSIAFVCPYCLSVGRGGVCVCVWCGEGEIAPVNSLICCVPDPAETRENYDDVKAGGGDRTGRCQWTHSSAKSIISPESECWGLIGPHNGLLRLIWLLWQLPERFWGW